MQVSIYKETSPKLLNKEKFKQMHNFKHVYSNMYSNMLYSRPCFKIYNLEDL